jgi:hypothetical protein
MTFTRKRVAAAVVVWLMSCAVHYAGCCAVALRLGWQPQEPETPRVPEDTRTVEIGRVLADRWETLMPVGCAESLGTALLPVCSRVWADSRIEVPVDHSRTVHGWASFQFADGRTCAAQYEMSGLVRERPQVPDRVSAFVEVVELDSIRLQRKLEPPKSGPPNPTRGITPGQVALVAPEAGSPLLTELFEVSLPSRKDVFVEIGRRGPEADVQVFVLHHSVQLENREVWRNGTVKVETPSDGLYQVMVVEKSRPSGIPRPFTVSVIWGDHWGTECPQDAEKSR